MITHAWLKQFALWAVLSLIACSDDSPINVMLGELTPAGSQVPDLEIIPRFTLDLVVVGSLKPNEPILVTAVMKGHKATSAVEFKLVAPEVEMAKRTGWDDSYGNQVEVRVPSLIDQTVASHNGSVHRATSSLTIPHAGLYQLVLTARKLSDEPNVEGGYVVQEFASQTVYVTVDSSAGRAELDVDLSSLRKDIVPSLGPYRKLHIARPQGRALRTSVVGILHRVTFYDQASGTYKPLAGARISGEIFDNFDNKVVGILSGYLGANGHYDPGCPSQYDTIYGYFHTDNFDVRVLPDVVAGFGTWYPSDCGRTVDVVATSRSSAVYTNMNLIIPASRLLLGRSRGKLTVEFHSADTRSYYQDPPDRIFISTLNNNVAVYGQNGMWVQAHEYGHAVHQKALGGAGIGYCPLNRSINTATNLRCAYSEGFANYHGVTVRPNDVGQLYSDFEADVWSGPGQDGSIIEGAVGSFFLDMTDPANEAHDSLAYPGLYLSQIIQTCEVLDTAWRRGNGIDHLIYCFERVVDNTIKNSFFVTRSPKPTSQREAATEPTGWSLSKIRAAWKRNLYGL